MERYLDIFLRSFSEYWAYLKNEMLFTYDYKPWWENYLYWLILLSLVVWGLELLAPWRKGQKAIRRDFLLDAFYMFFNFFIISLIGFNAVSNVAVELFNDFLGLFGVTNLVAIELGSWPVWAQFGLMFVVADLIHWNVHRLLHTVPRLWEFHKVHHSVKEMGFAAHLRFHWMETIVYKSLQYIPLAMLGFGLKDFFILHMFTLLIGHLNHANLNLDYGPLRYILNNPKMHIWHHVKDLPESHPNGINFGISLSLWDYIFGTAVIPSDGRDIELGFPDEEGFPQDFLGQAVHGVVKR